MTKKDLYLFVQNTVNDNPGAYGFEKRIPNTKARDISEAVLDALVKMLQDGDRVYLSGFGTFKHVKTKARNVTAPTGEKMVIPEGDKITFRLTADTPEGDDEE